ncbi:2Fe-2S iron-sulfur cluster-binding protein [Natronosalvus rutilus]|uniref:2Fe-2S iron-sulfur cluster-binding protein n=1 Tax=Natronosalvus rutilus TaxID=2953753 RepID=A0A9E7N841_9EURY|nr:2Fe-2S iron-sulfur cluster-binding protein [Natronosalvus rutilus]UTF52279.1 2Fe-2S iron-sulfur cluster-binding protein [Natronosalvus rutilus]
MTAPDDGSRPTRGRSATHDLTLEWRDNREQTVRASEDETVLIAAERTGVNLPFGCLTGACTTCTGRVLDGRIEHSRPPRGLKPSDLDDGYALLCIAEPRADCRIEVGVQTDLVSNPWK